MSPCHLLLAFLQTAYQIRLPPRDAIEAALDKVNNFSTSVSSTIVLVTFLGGFVLCLYKYGELTMYKVCTGMHSKMKSGWTWCFVFCRVCKGEKMHADHVLQNTCWAALCATIGDVREVKVPLMMRSLRLNTCIVREQLYMVEHCVMVRQARHWSEQRNRKCCSTWVMFSGCFQY